ncbi:hypothetical protein BU16DRAFT_311608 [Lophium mytilinum]|uniref:Uncharacterized protein n=1 Tax=Lophium mytilinum TaxID=390894 RepID=A0A6A6QYJ3_9PEZI|nr:hypothetical protein BU16DRAFT_311608 [Lophium mytilinum]
MAHISEEESDDDSHIGYEDWVKPELCAAIEGITRDEDFAVFGTRMNPVNPGLRVSGYGDIRIPLADEHFGPRPSFVVGPAQLLAHCENAWTCFGFQNPSGLAYINELQSQVARELGIRSGHCSKPTLLLCSQVSSTTLPSQSDDSIATMVFCLPSRHLGGEITFNSNGETKAFNTDQTSPFDLSYFAWYSDVNVKLAPVTSGRRLLLVCSVYKGHEVVGFQNASTIGASKKELQRVVTTWQRSLRSDQPCSTHFAYILDSVKGLELQVSGLDAIRVRNLHEICQKTGFRLLLASMERQVSGICEYDDDLCKYHTMEDELEWKVTLKCIVELDGTEVARDVTKRRPMKAVTAVEHTSGETR